MKSDIRVRPGLAGLVTLAGSIIVLALCAWSSAGTHAAAEGPPATLKSGVAHDWPILGGTPQRNMMNPWAKNVPTAWSIQEGNQKNIKWSAKLGSYAYGGPVVAGGKVFVGTNNDNPRNPTIKGDKGVVMCFREADGKFLWQAVHDKLPNPTANDWPQIGVASTPVVEGNRLYYVSNRCELICADTEGFLDGKNDGVRDEKYTSQTDADIIWRLDMFKELHVFPRYLANCSPLVAGDLLFVVTGNGVAEKGGMFYVPAPEAPSFLAVNKKTGKVVWKSNLPGDRIMNGQWSSPVYAEVHGKPQIIFPGGDGWLYAFEPKTGHLIWKFNCNPKASLYKPSGRGDRNYLVATPVVYDNKLYVGVGRDPDNEGPGPGHLWCVDISKTGDLSPVNDNFDPSAPVNKNSGLVWHFGGKAPKDAVRDYVFGRTLSSCAVYDGLVYAADLDGFLYCLDAKTGQKYWEEDLKTSVWGAPYWVDGKVYIGDDNGDVHIFAHGKAKKLLAKMEMEQAIQTTPVVANGVLYVMTRSRLYAIARK